MIKRHQLILIQLSTRVSPRQVTPAPEERYLLERERERGVSRARRGTWSGSSRSVSEMTMAPRPTGGTCRGEASRDDRTTRVAEPVVRPDGIGSGRRIVPTGVMANHWIGDKPFVLRWRRRRACLLQTGHLGHLAPIRRWPPRRYLVGRSRRLDWPARVHIQHVRHAQIPHIRYYFRSFFCLYMYRRQREPIHCVERGKNGPSKACWLGSVTITT